MDLLAIWLAALAAALTAVATGITAWLTYRKWRFETPTLTANITRVKSELSPVLTVRLGDCGKFFIREIALKSPRNGRLAFATLVPDGGGGFTVSGEPSSDWAKRLIVPEAEQRQSVEMLVHNEGERLRLVVTIASRSNIKATRRLTTSVRSRA